MSHTPQNACSIDKNSLISYKKLPCVSKPCPFKPTNQRLSWSACLLYPFVSGAQPAHTAYRIGYFISGHLPSGSPSRTQNAPRHCHFAGFVPYNMYAVGNYYPHSITNKQFCKRSAAFGTKNCRPAPFLARFCR